MADTADRPVTVRPRDVKVHGVTPGQLRSTRWDRLTHGLHARADPERETAELARMMSEVLPEGSGFGHLTSAAVRRWWLPNRLAPHVMLASTKGDLHVQRRGLYVRRSKYAEVERVDEIPLMTAPQTLLELAQDLSLVDLVPMVDRALAGGADAATILAAARPRARGAALLRRAVTLSDPRSESWWESVLRLMHVVTGLGPVECQVELWEGGVFLARADLHLVGTDRYPECDGGEHRTAERQRLDLRRDRDMSRAAHQRYGYTTWEIEHRPDLVIRDGEDARGLPHDPHRLRAWGRLAATSSLTPFGRKRLSDRLERYRSATERPPRVAASGPPDPTDGGKQSVAGAEDDGLPPPDAA